MCVHTISQIGKYEQQQSKSFSKRTSSVLEILQIGCYFNFRYCVFKRIQSLQESISLQLLSSLSISIIKMQDIFVSNLIYVIFIWSKQLFMQYLLYFLRTIFKSLIVSTWTMQKFLFKIFQVIFHSRNMDCLLYFVYQIHYFIPVPVVL